MIPWHCLEVVELPGLRSRMELWRRAEELSIRVNGEVLMNSKMRASEEAHATLACDRLPRAGDSTAMPSPSVLVGGLGMGWTLAAALRSFGPSAEVLVAELVPQVVQWNHGPLADLAGHPLADPRVQVHEGDVGALMRAHRAKWDVILLDVDNGPEAFTYGDNDSLYGNEGLKVIHRALRPGGILSVWSASGDAAFSRRLRANGFEPEIHHVRARGTDGPRHTIWIATR